MGMTPEQHAALVDGVPAYMREDMKSWLLIALSTPTPGGGRQSHVDLVMDFDRRARSTDPLAAYLRSGFLKLEQELYVDDEKYIQFLDFLVWNKSQDLGRV